MLSFQISNSFFVVQNHFIDGCPKAECYKTCDTCHRTDASAAEQLCPNVLREKDWQSHRVSRTCFTLRAFSSLLSLYNENYAYLLLYLNSSTMTKVTKKLFVYQGT